MISGISPNLAGNAKKAGEMEAADNKKREKDSFADLISSSKKEDPKPKHQTDMKLNEPKKLAAERKPDEKAKGPPAESPPVRKDEAKNEEAPDRNKMAKAGKRDKATQKLMDSFESEFGVPPQRMSEAMAENPPSLHGKSPEEAASDVVDRLSLSEKDREKALDMYVGFLLQQNTEKLHTKPGGEFGEGIGGWNAAAAGGGLGALGAGMTAKGQMLQKYKDLSDLPENSGANASGIGSSTGLASLGGMSAGLEAANASDPTLAMMAGAGAGAEGANELTTDVDPKTAKLRALMEKASQNQKATGELSAQLAALKTMKDSPDMQRRMLEALKSDVQNAQGAQNARINAIADKLAAEKLNGLMAGGAIAALANQQSEQDAATWSGSQQFNGEHSSESAGMSGANAKDMLVKELKKAAFKEKLSEALSGLEGANMGHAVQTLNMKDVGVGAAAAAGIPVQGEPNTPPIHQIMNQTQYLIKNGGGEMKVQLNPDGLGIVNLKVAVQDGKLSVNMAAEQKETKKMLESSLSELKSSLNAQHFAVDSVKIDVVHSARTDNDARNSMHQNFDQREGHRQFWQQFQENFGNSQRQNDWTDLAVDPKENSPFRYDPFKSVDSVSSMSMPRAMGSSMLNRVA